MHGAPGQLDANNMRDFVQKNSLERVAHEKRTKSIEHQKKAFVRQYSKDEQEVKDILQRLHVEQQIYDVDYIQLDAVKGDLEKEGDDQEEEEVFVNPYPITIIPKYGQTPVKQGTTIKKNNGETEILRHRCGRRKSLEFEDIPPPGCAKQVQHGRSSVTAISPATGRTRKLSSTSDQPDLADIWAGDPEFISSVRRPRKTSSDINHRKLLQRAMSDVWVQSNAESLSRLSVFARKCSADDLHKDMSLTMPSKKEREKIATSSKTSYDEGYRNTGAQDGTVTTSPERERKSSVNKDTSNVKDELKSTPSDNKSTLIRSGKKSSFRKSSKPESEMKAMETNDVIDAEGKENDVNSCGKSLSESGNSRMRKIGRTENVYPTIDLAEGNPDQSAGPQTRKRLLKKKRSMPEMKVGSPSTTSLEESSTDTKPRARHGSLKEKNKEKTEVKSRPRNGSFH
ncbi:uncharacterized protein LOC132543672 [Ylistrum balloti]|uniref:uncharacterized protein LOC132543672 n=1 Tax=Ylistrum balloti TaxID=509963 RepID=UPI002905CF5E|nr:uncharacterized protein LOC132543672 [Ylistrum balloti]